MNLGSLSLNSLSPVSQYMNNWLSILGNTPSQMGSLFNNTPIASNPFSNAGGILSGNASSPFPNLGNYGGNSGTNGDFGGGTVIP
jgi:hypothetical protein